jgi:hypothetical protein
MRVPSREELEQKAELLKKNVKSLQQLIDANIGQQVLVVETKERWMGGEGPGEKGLVSRTTALKLGIASDDSVGEMNGGLLVIPMQYHLVMRDLSGRHTWEKRQEPISIDALGIANLNNKVPYRAFETVNIEDMKSGLEVIAGDLSVACYFTHHQEEFNMIQQQRKEGKLTEDNVKQLLRSHYLIHPLYVLALKQLGIEPLPELQHQTQEYKDILVLELVKIGNWAVLDGKRKIPKEFDMALKLGMHKEPHVLDQGNGITIDIPVYIRSLCEKYKVQIPE